jgi:hypothetical protein
MPHRTSNAVEEAKTPEQKLDLIAYYLERMDRRDRMRMWGSYVHSMLTIIPMLFFLWSTWYLYAHFNDIFGMMMRQTARGAAQTTGEKYEDVLKRIQDSFGMGSTSSK